MKLEVIKIEEQPDGSAIVELELDQQARQFLLERGFNAVMMAAISHMSVEEE